MQSKKTSFTFVVSDFQYQPISIVTQAIVCGDFAAAAAAADEEASSQNRGFRGHVLKNGQQQGEGDRATLASSMYKSTWYTLNQLGLV